MISRAILILHDHRALFVSISCHTQGCHTTWKEFHRFNHWLLCLTPCVFAQADGSDNYFASPPPDGALNDPSTSPTWQEGALQTVSWKTSYANYTIRLNKYQYDNSHENTAFLYEFGMTSCSLDVCLWVDLTS